MVGGANCVADRRLLDVCNWDRTTLSSALTLARPMTATGPSQTSRDVQLESAKRFEADITNRC
jgi:hypothetical protein